MGCDILLFPSTSRKSWETSVVIFGLSKMIFNSSDTHRGCSSATARHLGQLETSFTAHSSQGGWQMYVFFFFFLLWTSPTLAAPRANVTPRHSDTQTHLSDRLGKDSYLISQHTSVTVMSETKWKLKKQRNSPASSLA